MPWRVLGVVLGSSRKTAPSADEADREFLGHSAALAGILVGLATITYLLGGSLVPCIATAAIVSRSPSRSTIKTLFLFLSSFALVVIGIWVVVVNDRVFVRPWRVKPGGWYRTFLEQSRGAIQIADRDIPVVAVSVRDKRVWEAIDRA